MHVSKMHTARLLTVSRNIEGGGDVYPGETCLGVSAQGSGCLPWGGVCRGGGVVVCVPACNGADTPPCEQND